MTRPPLPVVTAAGGRRCGPCTLCCTIMGVKELEKPACQSCVHENALNIVGCSIYHERPQSCRDFRCLWLQGAFPAAFRPDKIHAVADSATLLQQGDIVVVRVDPAHAGAHKHGPLRRYLQQFVRHGGNLLVIDGEQRYAYGRVAERAEALTKAVERRRALADALGVEGDE